MHKISKSFDDANDVIRQLSFRETNNTTNYIKR